MLTTSKSLYSAVKVFEMVNAPHINEAMYVSDPTHTVHMCIAIA